DLRRLFVIDDRSDAQLADVVPFGGETIDRAGIIRFHQYEPVAAPGAVPTSEHLHAGRRLPSGFEEALHGAVPSLRLDLISHHEFHRRNLSYSLPCARTERMINPSPPARSTSMNSVL